MPGALILLMLLCEASYVCLYARKDLIPSIACHLVQHKMSLLNFILLSANYFMSLATYKITKICILKTQFRTFQLNERGFCN